MNQAPSTHVNDKPYIGLAIASLVLGVLCFLFWPLTMIPAVICGHMALSRLKKDPDSFNTASRGMAIAGLATGYLFVTVAVFYAIFLIYLISSHGIH